MSTYHLDCSIPLAFQAQVAVVGGGPAGVCAAIAAARNGADTLLIESGGCLGGMATLGGVNPFMTCYDKTGETMIIRGLFEEIINRLLERGGAIHPKDVPAGQAYTSYITVGHNHVTPFEAETLKVVLDEMCQEAGVRVRDIRYWGSQPWGFASDLLLGFVCDLDGDPTIHRDDGELSYAEWVPRGEIFEEDDNISLTRAMVCAFKRGEL